MNHLKSLAFVTLPKAIHDPRINRREKLIARLEEQRKLDEAPSYAQTIKQWKKAPDGSRTLTERPARLKPWWKQDADGKVFLTVRAGLHPIEFEKGKTAISIGSLDRLDDVLSTLIAATSAGELDTFLELAAAKKPTKKAGKVVA